VRQSERDRAEAFLSWADERAGGMTARYKAFASGEGSTITAIWYEHCPSPGWGVGLTYGASLLAGSRTELLIVVQSNEAVWAWALADFVDRHRARIQDLGIDDTINWGEPIAAESTMDAFFIGPPAGAPDDGVVHLAGDDHVQLLQAFPVYASELRLVRELGGRAFAQRVGDALTDPRRSALV
jgi:Suppressor of fused protein (SUFU)